METLISAEDLRNRNYSEADTLELSQIMRTLKKFRKDYPNKQYIIMNVLSFNSREALEKLGYTIHKDTLTDHIWNDVWVIDWSK